MGKATVTKDTENAFSAPVITNQDSLKQSLDAESLEQESLPLGGSVRLENVIKPEAHEFAGRIHEFWWPWVLRESTAAMVRLLLIVTDR